MLEKLDDRLREDKGRRRSESCYPDSSFFMGNVVRGRLPKLFSTKKLIIFRQQPSTGVFKMGERARKAEVALRLVTVNPNPGPGGRGMSAEGKARR